MVCVARLIVIAIVFRIPIYTFNSHTPLNTYTYAHTLMHTHMRTYPFATEAHFIGHAAQRSDAGVPLPGAVASVGHERKRRCWRWR